MSKIIEEDDYVIVAYKWVVNKLTEKKRRIIAEAAEKLVNKQYKVARGQWDYVENGFFYLTMNKSKTKMGITITGDWKKYDETRKLFDFIQENWEAGEYDHGDTKFGDFIRKTYSVKEFEWMPLDETFENSEESS